MSTELEKLSSEVGDQTELGESRELAGEQEGDRGMATGLSVGGAQGEVRRPLCRYRRLGRTPAGAAASWRRTTTCPPPPTRSCSDLGLASVGLAVDEEAASRRRHSWNTAATWRPVLALQLVPAPCPAP